MSPNRGPLPKPEGQAINKGRDWTHVSEDGIARGPDLGPKRPDGEAWYPATLTWWNAVRRHPVAATWDEVAWCDALLLANLHDHGLQHADAGRLSEARRRADDLGLSVAGRARLRIAIVEPTAVLADEDVDTSLAPVAAIGHRRPRSPDPVDANIGHRRPRPGS